MAGQRAYQLARRGEEVHLAPREVTVDAFEEMWREDDRVGLFIACSSGTYVRALVSDFGDAYCEELRRTAIGPFSVDDADPEAIVGLDEALSFLPAVELSAEDGRRAGHGRAVHGRAESAVRLRDPGGLVAVGEPQANGSLKPVVGFRG